MQLTITETVAPVLSQTPAPHHYHQRTLLHRPDYPALTPEIINALHSMPCILAETHEKYHYTIPSHCTDKSLCLSLFATTCYYGAVAQNLTQALGIYFGLTNTIAENVHIALHEAISNAVIHGNLAVSGIVLNHANFSDYYRWIESKLEVPAFAFSRVYIGCEVADNTLTLAVIDEGEGYSYADYLATRGNHAAHKGIQLIQASCQAVDVMGSGNRIQMQFAL